MKLAWACAILGLLAPPASAETTTYHADPIHVEIHANDTPSCLTTPLAIPCPAGYDDNTTTDPTDDTLHTYHSIDTLTIRADAPVPAATLDLAHTRIDHPMVALGSDLLINTEAAIPPPAGDMSSTERYDTGAKLTLHFIGLNGTTPTGQDYYVPFFLLESDRNGTNVPTGILYGGLDSDEWVPSQALELARACWASQLGGEQAVTCDLLPARVLQGEWAALTPDLRLGVQFNRTDIRGDETTPDADPGQSAASPAERTTISATSTAINDEHTFRASNLPTYQTTQLHMTPSVDIDPAPIRLQQSVQFDAAAPTPLLPALMLGSLIAAGLALYQRVTRARALQHEARARILAHVEAKPGVLVGRVAKELGLDYHSAAHHVRVLRRCGHLDIAKAGRNYALYPAGRFPHHQREAIAHLRRGPLADTLRRISEQPGQKLTDLARHRRCTKAAMHAQVHTLLSLGLVERNASSRLFVTARGSEVLNLLGEKLPVVLGQEARQRLPTSPSDAT
jgi:DNA-binding MarR family transcriptional regulator